MSRLAPALLIALLLTTTLSAQPSDADSTAGAQEPTDHPLELVELTPWVEPDGEFVARFSLSRPIPLDAEVTYSIRSPVNESDQSGRTQFLAGLSGEDAGPALHNPVTRPALQLLEGPAELVLRIPVSSTGDAGRTYIPNAGVHPVVIEVTAGDELIDEQVVHLVRLPEDVTDPLRIAFLFSVGAPVALQPDGSVRLDAASREQIAAVVDLLGQASGTELSVRVTPETVTALTATADPGDADLLEDLAAVTSAREVLQQPYTELDIGAWSEPALSEELELRFQAGDAALVDLLGAVATRSTWQPDSTLTTGSTSVLEGYGVTNFVIRDDFVSPDDDAETGEPFLLAADGTTPVGLATDQLLQAQLSTGVAEPIASAYRFLAHLAVIYFEDPDAARGLVIAPESIDNLVFYQTILDGLESGTIVSSATTGELFEEVPVGDTDQAPIIRQLTGSESEPLGDYPSELSRARGMLVGYSSMVADTTSRADFLAELLLVSGARTLTASERQRYLDTVTSTIEGDLSQIRAPRQRTITLAAREAVLPLSLENRLEFPVEVSLEMDSDQLEFPDGDVMTVLLQPGDNRLSLKVTTRTSGEFPLVIEVTSPDGSLPVTLIDLDIRSTAVSGVGLVISIGALLFLLGWWATNFRRTRRDRRLVTPEDPVTPTTPEPSSAGGRTSHGTGDR
ncbi:MAG: hypothetical protein JJLCMIEE_01413 [Acidimicrobiales bacterium]|nr:MAG: hypothetical protein EDR02_06660 [Actinomycetota bacterium]MBV6508353.1 hypothetical protein [Acidimicrobiales bacterium]RIK04828.1 MAG: hypothetical protein DCC48_12355 [Acidobacteriota bacterium]